MKRLNCVFLPDLFGLALEVVIAAAQRDGVGQWGCWASSR